MGVALAKINKQVLFIIESNICWFELIDCSKNLNNSKIQL